MDRGEALRVRGSRRMRVRWPRRAVESVRPVGPIRDAGEPSDRASHGSRQGFRASSPPGGGGSASTRAGADGRAAGGARARENERPRPEPVLRRGRWGLPATETMLFRSSGTSRGGHEEKWRRSGVRGSSGNSLPANVVSRSAGHDPDPSSEAHTRRSRISCLTSPPASPILSYIYDKRFCWRTDDRDHQPYRCQRRHGTR